MSEALTQALTAILELCAARTVNYARLERIEAIARAALAGAAPTPASDAGLREALTREQIAKAIWRAVFNSSYLSQGFSAYTEDQWEPMWQRLRPEEHAMWLAAADAARAALAGAAPPASDPGLREALTDKEALVKELADLKYTLREITADAAADLDAAEAEVERLRAALAAVPTPQEVRRDACCDHDHCADCGLCRICDVRGASEGSRGAPLNDVRGEAR